MLKNEKQLINNLIGQFKGIKRMIDEEKDCFDILMQMKAVRSGTSSLMNKFIENNFRNCLASCEKTNQKKLSKLITELIKK